MSRFSIPMAPAAAENTYVYGDARVSVICDGLLRVETKPFNDYPTQKVWHRNLGVVRYQTTQQDGVLTVTTSRAAFAVSDKGKLLHVKLGNAVVTDFSRGNLKGTARTLDNAWGAIKLSEGLVSAGGVTVMTDDSLLLKGEDIVKRAAGKDYYVFAYGRDYRACMRAFYGICGQVPLIPKYALGNWWSRYKAYTQEEYEGVIARFEREKIPVTVATIDMDWHWVDVIKRFGKEAKAKGGRNFADRAMAKLMPGWTGYSWNTDLFPDHKAFLRRLQEGGYHVTLNVHPSHGVRFFEDRYPEMCEAMGLDPDKKPYIRFKLGDKRFLQAYFDVLHHPLEKEGVDFWWLDWQQGKRSDVEGLDPLWAVNHYHYLDSDRGDKRPLILSRYAGDGSHRYPLGFSGDSAQNWASLRFQPYFTANAANAGYTWWSHDIGGHHFCRKDDELFTRWVQFGIFSPIHRLHSTANEFMSKEPWRCGGVAHRTIRDCMRLRHRLIPYIYSAAYRTHKEGVALCEPMYYGNPLSPEAYTVPNEYRFGSQLIVAPITEKANETTMRASVKVWLPEGTYTDVFTGAVYRGGRYYTMCRDLTKIPVLASAGAIIPMYRDADSNNLSNDQPLEVYIYHGNGQFVLYEDDGETKAYKRGVYAKTEMSVREEGNRLTFTIAPFEGDESVVPSRREVTLRFADVDAGTVVYDGVSQPLVDGAFTVAFDADKGVTVCLESCRYHDNAPVKEQVIDVISSYQMNHGRKLRRFGYMVKRPMAKLRAGKALRLPVEEVQAIQRGMNDERDKR